MAASGVRREGRRRAVPGALDLVEEAIHVLRGQPLSLLALYYCGALPFVLGFLFFWTDMSLSAYGGERCPAAALGLALLFVWMKSWQAAFGAAVADRVAGRPRHGWGIRRAAAVATIQAAVQPSALLVLPLALLAGIPFAWAYAFYQNVTVCGGGERPSLHDVVRLSGEQARVAPRQNHLLLAVLLLFACFVFVDVVVGMAWLPGLLKSLFGVESVFTRSTWHLFNSTFFAIALALVYLCVDPIVKAAYALRCFYGRSLRTGEDLRLALARLARASTPGVLLAVLLLAGAVPPAAATAPGRAKAARPVEAGGNGARPPAAGDTVAPRELDLAIRRVIAEPEYAWRMPRDREEGEDGERSFLILALEKTTEVLRAVGRSLGEGMRTLRRWLGKLFPGRERPWEEEAGGRFDWMLALHVLLLVLLGTATSILAVALLRARRRRAAAAGAVAPETRARPDVADEDVVADELPASDWLALAEELAQRGDRRLAVRALHLGGLSLLACSRLITTGRHKSNRDYRLELERREHALPGGVLPAFRRNVAIVERAWYGTHVVTEGLLAEVRENLRMIGTGVSTHPGLRSRRSAARGRGSEKRRGSQSGCSLARDGQPFCRCCWCCSRGGSCG